MRRSKRLLLIGSASDYGRGVMKGVLDYCRINGRWEYRLENDVGSNTVEVVKTAISEWKPHGIIARIVSDDVSAPMLSSGASIVRVGEGGPDIPSVLSDNISTGRLVARHFLDNGFRNFAYYANIRAVYSQIRRDGFAAELSAAGFNCETFQDQDTPSVVTHWTSDRQRMDRWVLSLKKPVGVMCVYDTRGQEISRACHRLGIRVPDDVAIVGVGNDELLCQLASPPLSSVDVDLRRTGYEAARLLHRMLHGAKPPSQPILTPPRRVVVRQSSDIIAVTDPDVAAALRFIRQHADEGINVKQVIGEVPISRKTLERHFADSIGHSPREEITRVRIERSKSLLEETELSVPAIARGVGFNRQSIFSTFFRRETGLTPTHYRRNRLSPTGESSSRSEGATHIIGGSHTHKPGDSPPTLSREYRQRLDKLAASTGPYSRLKPSKMRAIILAMCQEAFLTAVNLGELLHRNPKGLRERFLKPMMDEGLLHRKYPDEPSRPDQAYTAKPQTQPAENTGAIPRATPANTS